MASPASRCSRALGTNHPVCCPLLSFEIHRDSEWRMKVEGHVRSEFEFRCGLRMRQRRLDCEDVAKGIKIYLQIKYMEP